MTGTVAIDERKRQTRIIWTLLLLLVLLVPGGINVYRKAAVPVPHDGLAIMDTAAGLGVISVASSSPAHLAGIRTGDIITDINGLAVGTAVEYGRALGASGTAAVSVYSLIRDGRQFNRVVRVVRSADGSFLYTVLVLSGMASLLLGGMVGIFGRHARESTLLALICFTFAGVMIFSPIGVWDRFDVLVNAFDDTGTLLLPAFFLGFCLWFPSPAPGHGPGFRRGRLAITGALTVSCGLALLFGAWYAGLLARPGNPYTTTTMYSVLRRLALGWLGAAFVLGGLVAAVRTARAGEPIRRQQLLWISLGTLLGGTPPLAIYFIPYLAGFQPSEWQMLSLLALVLIPVSFGIAVLRYRLADAPLVFKRSMVYTLSSAATLFIVLLALGAAARWLPALSDPRRATGMIFWAVTAMTVSAIFFPRIRDSLSRSADRLHFGARMDHRERLAAFDPFRLDPSLPPERWVEMFLDDITLALEVETVRFLTAAEAVTPGQRHLEQGWAEKGSGRCRVVQLAAPWEGFYQLLVMESAGGGQCLGAIALGPRRGGALLTSQDLEALLPAAELLAMALENSTLTRRLMEQQRLASIGQLAAGVAHEINTPLTGISSYTEMLLENLPPESSGDEADGRPNRARALEQKEMLKKIGLQAERAEKIVSSLLQFARMKGGARGPADLNQVTRQAVALYDHRLKECPVDFSLELSDGPLPVTGDAGQLQQVLINLMSNALGAMPEGGELQVTTRSAGEKAIVLVSDSGPGIPARIRHRIFEPFFTTRPPGSGTGLGLSICYGIIREHQGDITVDSRPGSGTVFTVTLPRGSVSQ